MYTNDGLFYNLFFYDALVLLCGCLLFVSGLIAKRKRKKNSESCIWLGAIAIAVCTAMFASDYSGISKQDFVVSTGTIEYWHSAKRQAPFTYEYTFRTNEAEKLQTYYLDAFTLRRHLGDGFEFAEDATYQITYERSSRVIVGVEVMAEQGSH